VNFQTSQAKQKQKISPQNLIKSWDVTFSLEGMQSMLIFLQTSLMVVDFFHTPFFSR
jgi:hypothetical protein